VYEVIKVSRSRSTARQRRKKENMSLESKRK
jgi:hypothetical protein